MAAYTPSPYDTEGDYWTDPASANARQETPPEWMTSRPASSPVNDPGLFDGSRVQIGNLNTGETDLKFFALCKAEAEQALQRVDANWRDTAVSMANAAAADYRTRVKAGQAPERASAGAYEAFKAALAAKGGAPPPVDPTKAQSQVTTSDRATALNAFRGAVNDGRTNLKEVLDNPVNNDPSASGTFNPIQGGYVTAPKIVLPNAPQATKAVAAAPIQVTEAQAQQAVAAGPINVTKVGPAAPIPTALQNRTNVEGTTLGTDLSDQSRAQQQGAIADLAATSQGRGQAQILAEERAKQDQTKAANLLAASARTARGSERKGAAVHARLLANQSALEGAQNRATLNAQTAIGAQAALGSTLQGVRSTDVGVEAKRADLQAQRSQLQAQLDAAKAANDQNAINTINTKMADLDREADRINAEAANAAAEGAAGRQTTTSGLNAQLGTQTSAGNAAAKNAAGEAAAGRQTTVSLGNAAAANNLKSTVYTTQAGAATQDAANQLATDTGNVERQIGIQKANNEQGLAAALGQTTQDVQQAEIRIKINEAIQKAGQNLLDQESRDEALKMAKEQFTWARARADREAESYWYDKIATLALGAVPIAAKLIPPAAAAALAKGGMVSRPTLAMVGEGEHRELVIPISGKLSKALEKKLANESKPFRQPVPVAALVSVIKKTTANLDEPPPRLDAKTYARLSAYMTRAKKSAQQRSA